MSELARTGEDTLPYELLAQQVAKEELETIVEKYGNNPHVLASAIVEELPQIVHNSIELGLSLADNFGDISPAELIQAYAAGANLERGDT